MKFLHWQNFSRDFNEWNARAMGSLRWGKCYAARH
jgi:hypothetical protein